MEYLGTNCISNKCCFELESQQYSSFDKPEYSLEYYHRVASMYVDGQKRITILSSNMFNDVCGMYRNTMFNT